MTAPSHLNDLEIKCMFASSPTEMFRTELKRNPSGFHIGLDSSLLSMGSCFANEMGQKFQKYKFDISTNPGGVLFNPMSIFRLMAMALNEVPLPGWSFAEREGMQVNYLLHSDMRHHDLALLQDETTQLFQNLKRRLESSAVIILTFGTAFVHQLRSNGEIVANCHKIPQAQFEKRLLSPEEVVGQFGQLIKLLNKVNPQTRFLLTVSPVRHLKEGIPENNLSKSILRLACHQLEQAYDSVYYFPSYELMMDDLRDYRFYKSDLIHPNEQALDYIWNHFADQYLDEPARAFISEWKKILSALSHSPFNEGSAAHHKFLVSTLQKVQNYSDRVDVSEEVAQLQRQLNQT